jgi:hypothetical protein
MTVDGSSTPVTFTAGPISGVTYEIYGLVLTIHSTGMDLGTASELRVFGAAGALSTGIKIIEDIGSTVDIDVFPTPVKKLVDFYRYASWSGNGVQVVGHTDAIAAGTDSLVVVLSWSEDDPLVLEPPNTETIGLKVSDNLSSLTLFEAHIFGRQYRTSRS